VIDIEVSWHPPHQLVPLAQRRIGMRTLPVPNEILAMRQNVALARWLQRREPEYGGG
jgi:hypothetical protein